MPPTKKKPMFGAWHSEAQQKRGCSLFPFSAGFVDNAEVMNSRAAMIGFFALILLEAVAGKGILELMGIGAAAARAARSLPALAPLTRQRRAHRGWKRHRHRVLDERR